MSNQAVKPLSILSIGVQVGANLITNEHLIAAGVQVDQASGVAARSSSLLQGHDALKGWLKQSNKERLLAQPSVTTDLGVSAVLDAVKKAAISHEQLGLIIGDSITPIEVTPSEGQRITGKLSLKIPSYDLSAGSGAFVVHMDSLRRWKADRVPQYACAVSSNAASHLIGQDLPFFCNFSDGASALIISNQHEGKFVVEDSFLSSRTVSADALNIKKFGAVEFQQSNYVEEVRKGYQESLERLKLREGAAAMSDGYFIGSQCLQQVSNALAVEYGFHPDRCLTLGNQEGDSIGATPGIILSRASDTLEPGRKVFVVQAGIGFSGGYVSLRVAK